MRYLALGEVVRLHQMLIEQSGGATGIRDLGVLDSALAQPKATFDGQDLHPSLVDKAAALCTSLVQNHPFVDGNKRIGHAAMATFLMLNGVEIAANTNDQERLILDLASGRLRREDLAVWLRPMASLDWSQCPVVESIPGKVSGAWVFRGTRTPVAVVFENLEDGLTLDELMEQFPLTREQITAVLEFAARSANLPLAPADDFQEATGRVLDKHGEIYRRLG